MSRREKKKRRVFNLYNFAVLLCLVIIFGALFVLFEQDSKMIPVALREKYVGIKTYVVTKFEEWTSSKEGNDNEKNTNSSNSNQTNNSNTNNTKNNETNSNINNKGENNNATINSTGDANEAAARLIAASKFRELGEIDVAENNLDVMKIQRQGEEYYHISSTSNSLEIKIASGEITRVNGIPVEQ